MPSGLRQIFRTPRRRVAGAGLVAILMLTAPVLWVRSGSRVFHPEPSRERRPVPEDLADRLRDDVRHLSETIGERHAYRPEALEAAAVWIEGRFRALGYEVRRLPVEIPDGPPFHTGPMTVWNVEASRRGTTRPNDVLVVGGHYDSKVATPHWRAAGPPQPERVGTPGANDNASAVAGLLAIADHLAEAELESSLRLVAFVNEEPPFFRTDSMGSLVYARALAAEPETEVLGMISMDLIGCYSPQVRTKRIPGTGLVTGLPDRPDYVAFLSNRRSRGFAREVAATFRREGAVTVRTAAIPAVSGAVAWSDDWAFWQVGIPAFTVTDTAWLRHDHYHELSDTWDRLDYPVMAEVVWGLARTVGHLVGTKP